MNQVQKIVQDIFDNKLYKVKLAPEGQLSKFSLDLDNNRTFLFLTDVANPSLNEFQSNVEKDIRNSIKKLNDDESFNVGNYNIHRCDDYTRKYTTEEQVQIKKYGYAVIPAIHKVIVFTNKVTNEETLKITKLRGAKN